MRKVFSQQFQKSLKYQVENGINEKVITETPMLNNEPTTVTSTQDACAIPVTINTKRQEDILAIQLINFFLFVLVLNFL